MQNLVFFFFFFNDNGTNPISMKDAIEPSHKIVFGNGVYLTQFLFI